MKNLWKNFEIFEKIFEKTLKFLKKFLKNFEIFEKSDLTTEDLRRKKFEDNYVLVDDKMSQEILS